jgi:AraC family transcriptional regulator
MSGSGWRVEDVVCTFGPGDRPFEERHETACIALVTNGTFRYRSEHGAALLSPGALLLGNHRHSFECSHEHSTGDRCLSFHFTPEFLDTVVADVSGARRSAFVLPALPPVPALLPVLAAAEAARDDEGRDDFEELALELAGAVFSVLAGTEWKMSKPTRGDERRVSAALRQIESRANEPISLRDLAGTAAMSPYHFLRTFRGVVGMTPHQYVLHTRLHRAAVRLRRTDDSISSIAFDAGFNDLSTFNRRFRRTMGLTPGTYRG